MRADGRAIVDDTGSFHPLGLTWMWALYGQKHERDRIKQHLDFLAPYGYDYVRILGEVTWPGEVIDPNWPDYEDILGSFIDDAYEVAGLRTQITIFGSGSSLLNPMTHAEKIVRVVNAGRLEKVMALEVSNESFATGPSMDVMVQVARYLRSHLPHLVALSTPMMGDAASIEEMIKASQNADAQLYTAHTDRDGGDQKWRQIRQAWDFKDLPGRVSHNEPPGPNSSVNTNDSPLQLAMMRATGVVSGGAFYVLHVGDMVYGRDMPEKHRKANLWEVDNIDMILKAVRGIDPLLPAGLPNWTRYNQNWVGHPLTADMFWADGDGKDHGVNRNYSAVSGGDFIVMLDGVKNRVVNTALRACHVEAVDPVTGQVLETDLHAGQTWELPGSADTLVGYIVRGAFL